MSEKQLFGGLEHFLTDVLVAERVLADFLQHSKSKRKRTLQLIVLKFQLISQIVINFQRHGDSAAYLRERKRQLGLGKWVKDTLVGGNPTRIEEGTRREVTDKAGSLPQTGSSTGFSEWDRCTLFEIH